MQNKIYTVAIIGVGSRGALAYGRKINGIKDKFKIVSLCDIKRCRLDTYGEEFGVPENARFDTEEEFFKERRADILIIATLDQDHVRHCLCAFKLGYDVLLEKPITADASECKMLLDAQKKYGNRALVCHVLRYAPAYLKVAELIDGGEIGRLVAIEATEPVGYDHQSHSYVRGNWRDTKETSPMILAKCCHDLDLLQWYAKSKCKSISSVGDLTFFNEQNAPEGAAKRCTECKYSDTCAYSAKVLYLDNWFKLDCPEDYWPYNVAAEAPLTEKKLREAIEEGPYGRCVFHCDNNAVDHQMVQMTFENGVKASLTMTAFVTGYGRHSTYFGTGGVIDLDDEYVTLRKFGGETVRHSLAKPKEGGHDHGGGDTGLISSLYEMLEGRAPAGTSLEASIESHLMGIAAEESRLDGGRLVLVHK
ncbi:MAG: Gfo/Idh/MocA family oxidoreductase [Clostridia bacterium]|nr:Gfo/Idh/MocA family oxidoreductase [Clostridia bacterium]